MQPTGMILGIFYDGALAALSYLRYDTLHGYPFLEFSPCPGRKIEHGMHLVGNLTIGVEDSQVDEVISAIERSCESHAPQKTGLFGLLGSGARSETGGPDHANIYVFDVEHYEEI